MVGGELRSLGLRYSSKAEPRDSRAVVETSMAGGATGGGGGGGPENGKFRYAACEWFDSSVAAVVAFACWYCCCTDRKSE